MIYTHTEIKKDTEEKFIPLTNDLLFKETFGNPRNIKYLESLLESYYGFNEGYLSGRVKVSYETNIDKDTYSEMANRCDLVATINNEILVNIEMYQNLNDEAMEKSRNYIMKIYSTELQIGDSYRNINKTTQINFVGKLSTKDFVIEDKLWSTYYYGPKSKKSEVKQDIIRLDIAKELDYNNDIFIRHLRMFGATTEEERKRAVRGDKLLMELNDWLEAYANDETLNGAFDDNYWNRRIARQEGIEEKQQEMVKNMLKENISIETIQKVSNLSIEEIEKLREE